MSASSTRMKKTSGSPLYIMLLLIPFLLASCNPYGQSAKFLYQVDSYPADHLIWSPSGRYLAFTSRSASLNKSSIFILDTNTKEAELFMTADYGHLEVEAWTPDETELVFFVDSSNEFTDGIWIAKINDQSIPKLLLDEQAAFGWSSMGQIAISRGEQNDPLLIYLQDSKTSEERIVFRALGGSLSPFSWSLDGAKLAFSLDLGEFRRRDLYIIDLDTLEYQQLTKEGMNDSPSLSPNGNMVVYEKGDFSGSTPLYSLHVMNSDGSCDTEVSGLTNVGSPAWSPDGRWIAFVGKDNRIFLFDVFTTFGEDFLVNGLSCNL